MGVGDPLLEGHGSGEGVARRLVLHQPVGHEVDIVEMIGGLEGVQVMFVPAIRGRHAPVGEMDALFEGRRGAAQEGRFVDAEGAQGVADGWKRAFTDADGADLGAFDQGDVGAAGTVGTENLGQVAGGQPAGGATANDKDTTRRRAIANFGRGHVALNLPRRALRP